MRLFDVYLAVDWSARSLPSPARPTRDALWVAEKLAPEIDDTDRGETYWRTRQACLASIRHHVKSGRRIFIGFDFCYGYPAGYAAALGLIGNTPPWHRIWNELTRLVQDSPTNANNRFSVAATLNARCAGLIPGPLWGCSATSNIPPLAPKSPGFPYQVRQGLTLEQFRHTERRRIGGQPVGQPVWKLYGSGSAGGQTLLGIPAVCHLRDDPEFAAISQVWPVETGFTPTPIPNQGPCIGIGTSRKVCPHPAVQQAV
jgi:hypothetical protein